MPICSLTRSLQSTGKQGFHNSTHKHTDNSRTSRLENELARLGRFSEKEEGGDCEGEEGASAAGSLRSLSPYIQVCNDPSLKQGAL